MQLIRNELLVKTFTWSDLNILLNEPRVLVKSNKMLLNQLEYFFDLTKSYLNKPFLTLSKDSEHVEKNCLFTIVFLIQNKK